MASYVGTYAEQQQFSANLRAAQEAPDPSAMDTHPSKRRADVVVAGRWAATVYENGGVTVADKHTGLVLAMKTRG